ncbi:histidine phosphatase superfamily protein, partial [Kipferlia bialata]|eukprot:g16717.t1
MILCGVTGTDGHGDRQPLHFLDPEKDSGTWKQGWNKHGQLTDLGQTQLYTLGKRLNSWYVTEAEDSLLSPTFE